jgi:hypothetical protein
MGWIGALVTVPALVMLGFMLWRRESDKGWRDQAEGLRERLATENPKRRMPDQSTREYGAR